MRFVSFAFIYIYTDANIRKNLIFMYIHKRKMRKIWQTLEKMAEKTYFCYEKI